MERILAVSIHCETVATETLAPQLIEDMWTLFIRHYTGMTRDVFEHDLMQKQQALILWRSGELAGFTSQRFETIQGHRVVFSGEVIVTPEARDIGTAHFFRNWAKAVWNNCDWWCALSAGPRTFRIPHTFCKRMTPNAAGDETTEERELRHIFAEYIYGDGYCRERGIVILDQPYTLREQDQQIREGYPMDEYFRSVNPGWQKGDELVNLINLHSDNWKPVALRILKWK